MSGAVQTEKAGDARVRQTAGSSSLGAWSLIVASNDEQVLGQTLLASPAIDERCQVIAMRGYRSAGAAYNAGIDKAQNDIMVFAHQDVYLPRDWTTSVERALRFLATDDPKWAVLGVFGAMRNGPHELRGHCYSTGLQSMLGIAFENPLEATSLDELLLVVRRSTGLRFDEELPGFHLYGTDICLQAQVRGLKAYVISAFCIHNSTGLKYFPLAFWRSYLYMRSKWWDRLPVATCCTTLEKTCGRMLAQIARDLKARLLSSRRPGVRHVDIAQLHRFLVQRGLQTEPDERSEFGQRSAMRDA